MPRGKKGSGRPKKLSRAARRDTATAALRVTAELASAISADISDGEESPDESMFSRFQNLKERVDKLGQDSEKEELEVLKEELEEWKDNMPESLQNGDKYNTLEESASALDSIASDLDNLEVPEFPPFPSEEVFNAGAGKMEDGRDWDLVGFLDSIVSLAEELTEYSESLETQADEADAVEFPGMVG